MTLEEIERAYRRQKEIQRLREEIKQLDANPMPSKVRAIRINGEEHYYSGGGSSLPSSPVEKHFRDKQQLEEKLTDAEQKQRMFWELAETIEDDEIRAIIYWRVERLKPWEKVARIVNGLGASRKTPYERLKRWTEKEVKE